MRRHPAARFFDTSFAFRSAVRTLLLALAVLASSLAPAVAQGTATWDRFAADVLRLYTSAAAGFADLPRVRTLWRGMDEVSGVPTLPDAGPHLSAPIGTVFTDALGTEYSADLADGLQAEMGARALPLNRSAAYSPHSPSSAGGPAPGSPSALNPTAA